MVMLVLVLQGCGGSPEVTTASGQNATATTAAGASTEASKNGLPIVDKPLTLTYFSPKSPDRGGKVSFNEILAYQEMEKRTGIHMEFQHSDVEHRIEQLNLMLASDDYPDIIDFDWPSFKRTPDQLIEDKVLIKLNELIDQYAPNYKKIMDSSPQMKKDAVTDKGTQFAFKYLYNGDNTTVWFGPIVRKDWLNKLKLNMPTTIDDGIRF